MEKVGFIGNYDKIDIILYTAKILTKLGKKVLVLDTTVTQKSRYIVPVINPTLSYITVFEDIDVAIGFKTWNQLIEYIGNEGELQYDFVLIDIDEHQGIIGTGLKITDRNYFVTGFDLYSLKKGIEILNNLVEPLKLTKILFEKEMTQEDDEYLNFLALGKKIVWGDDEIYFPIENGDKLVIAENQKLEKIKFKNLSTQYKSGVSYLVSHITDEDERKIKNIMKNLG
ncbi:MAG: hypothetical protein HFJ48_04510 [Clostridia bacterium]|nr:hypothetical protein [Clostridia bacterium]